jgi:hypothetical protein
VESTEIPTKFQAVKTGAEELKYFVDAVAQTCECPGYLMTGKICYHLAAVEIHQKGINKKKKRFF